MYSCIDWSGGNTTLVYNVTESQTVVKGGSEKLPFILPFTTVWGILLAGSHFGSV